MRNRITCSSVVLASGGFAFAGIWHPDWLVSACEHILKMGDWIMSLVVVAVTLALLVCCWLPAFRQKKEISCKKEGTHSAFPHPQPGWKCITGIRFKTDLCVARLKERDPRFHPEQQYIVVKDYVVCVEIDGTSNLSVKVRGSSNRSCVGAETVSPIRRARRTASGGHDRPRHLYVAWQIHGLVPTDDMRLFSDKVMLAAMLASGMGCKAHAIYWAIRLFGACIFYGRNRKPWILEKENMPQCCCRESEEPDKEEGRNLMHRRR